VIRDASPYRYPEENTTPLSTLASSSAAIYSGCCLLITRSKAASLRLTSTLVAIPATGGETSATRPNACRRSIPAR
jgi:hypothetical protein